MKTTLLLQLCIGLMLAGSSSAAEPDRKAGKWEQFTWYEDRWRSTGIFVVLEASGGYSMLPESQKRDATIINTKGIFDVKFTGRDWTFRSDLGDGKIAIFKLTRTEPGMYLGWASLGDHRDRNLWLLVD